MTGKYTKAARFITFASTHAIVGTAALFYLVYILSPSLKDFITIFFTALFTTVVIPVIYVIYLLKKGKIQNFHMKKHKERILPFLVIFASGILSILAIKYLGASSDIIKLGTIFLLMSAGYVAITFKYKISGHGFVFTSSVLFLSFFANYQFLLLLLFLIPIGWSRIYLKEHTLGEFVGGATYALASFYVLSLFLG